MSKRWPKSREGTINELVHFLVMHDTLTKVKLLPRFEVPGPKRDGHYRHKAVMMIKIIEDNAGEIKWRS